jgi:SAM-dependent methyltransferase
MNEIFGAPYANAYDTLYQDKDYPAECDLVEALFRAHGVTAAHDLLDLGCGTGGHAIELARRGYDVVGVDRSASMLALAREKAARAGAADHLSLHEGDVRTVRLARQFDAVLCMFAVLGYQTDNDAAIATLATAAAHLRPGGLFLADVWFGPAVLRERPTQRTRVIPTPGGYVLRAVEPTLEVTSQVVTVDYRLWQIEANRVASETREQHVMRYFFPQELDLLLRLAGLSLVRLTAFPTTDQAPDETTWNILVVARRDASSSA